MTHRPADPVDQFWNWYHQAEHVSLGRRIVSWIYPPAVIHQPDAMTLATCTRDGTPSARIVLFKGIQDGGFVFFTNYTSRKGHELIENPKAALVFHWAFPERQVRVEGRIEKLSYEKSSAYWKTRPRGSQLSGAASPQSQRIGDRSELVARITELEEQYRGREVPCPEHWGGFRLVPHRIEFWEARINRFHERVEYIKSDSDWKQTLLAP